MSDKQIALEVAQFLDAPAARRLGIARDDLKRLANAFVAACYEGLGKAPWLIDGEDVRVLMTNQVPARLRANDPLAERGPAAIEALLEHLAGNHVVTQAFEIRNALEASAEAFRDNVRSGRYAGLAAAKVDPFVHGASKLGRNDPCSCGSGKKFKKCHGKDE